MAKIRILEPQILNREVYIKVPVVRGINAREIDLERIEDYFVKKRDASRDYSQKRGYDLCRAVVKWATCCGARVAKCSNETDDYGGATVDFVFCFSSLSELSEFEKYFTVNVNGSAM